MTPAWPDGRFVCGTCEKIFASARALVAHVHEHRPVCTGNCKIADLPLRVTP